MPTNEDTEPIRNTGPIRLDDRLIRLEIRLHQDMSRLNGTCPDSKEENDGQMSG